MSANLFCVLTFGFSLISPRQTTSTLKWPTSMERFVFLRIKNLSDCVRYAKANPFCDIAFGIFTKQSVRFASRAFT